MTSIRDLMPPPPVPFTGTPWWERRIVGFDLETTHADPEDARIVVAAVVEVGAGQPPTSRSWLVDPGIEISADATAVHGITTEQAREAGYFAGDVLPEILDALAARPEGSALVIFNARYDMTVGDREARRYGLVPLHERGPLHLFDPFIADKHLDKYRPGKRTLSAIAGHYGIRLDEDAHDADYDALLACRLAWKIATAGKVIRRHAHEVNPLQAEWDRIRPDIEALQPAQQQWARFEAASLALHFRRAGNHRRAGEVRQEWPVIPFADTKAKSEGEGSAPGSASGSSPSGDPLRGTHAPSPAAGRAA